MKKFLAVAPGPGPGRPWPPRSQPKDAKAGQDPARPRPSRRPRPGQARRGRAQALRQGRHARFQDPVGHVQGPHVQGQAPLRDPQGRAGQGLPARRPDQEEPQRRRATPARASTTWSSAGSSGRTRSCCGPSPTPTSPIPTTPSTRPSTAMNTATIMMAFPVEALAADGSPGHRRRPSSSPSDVNEIPVKKTLGGQNIDAARTFLDKVRVYPHQPERRGHPDLQSQAAQLPPGLPAPVRRHAAPAAQPDGRRPLLLRQAAR